MGTTLPNPSTALIETVKAAPAVGVVVEGVAEKPDIGPGETVNDSVADVS